MGTILAGGRSSRFGSDKALALHEGKPLIAHVRDSLAIQCEAVIVCGRGWEDLLSVADWPAANLGPMGGLCAALRHAKSLGFEGVLSAPCDMPGLPTDVAAKLLPGPAVVQGHWLVGLWPVSLLERLEAGLRQEGNISARRWAEIAEARHVDLGHLRNINRREDL